MGKRGLRPACPAVPIWKVTRATARFMGPLNPHLVGKDHEAVVCLASDGPTHTLGSMAHGIEGEKVILSDLELVPQVLQPRLWVRRWGSGPFLPVPPHSVASPYHPSPRFGGQARP